MLLMLVLFVVVGTLRLLLFSDTWSRYARMLLNFLEEDPSWATSTSEDDDLLSATPALLLLMAADVA